MKYLNTKKAQKKKMKMYWESFQVPILEIQSSGLGRVKTVPHDRNSGRMPESDDCKKRGTGDC